MLPRLEPLLLALLRDLMHMPVTVDTVTSILLTITVQLDERLDKVDGHLGILAQHVLDAVAHVRAG